MRHIYIRPTPPRRHFITIRTVIYQPSFNGAHNKIKAKTWLLLYERSLAGEPGVKLADLAKLTGAGYKSLSVLISRWIRWRYVGYRKIGGCRKYHINKLGERWLKRWADSMPLETYLRELEAVRGTEG